MTSTAPILFKKYGVDRIHPHLYIRAPLPLCGLGQHNATARLQRQAKCENSWVATNERFAVATNTAWTGNTPSSGAACRLRTVHPRVGGEHQEPQPHLRLALGSSPRGRGTRIPRVRELTAERFIPAWAGNTPSAAFLAAPPAVHPRVGGEHPSSTAYCAPHYGSSPRGRGTPEKVPKILAYGRFIPAWAGNTGSLSRNRCSKPVHPRVGGEHDPWYSLVARNLGSSPRGRGTQEGDAAAPPCSTGSSPRGRGTQRQILNRRRQVRFIPAWAGNTNRRPDPDIR